MKQHSVLKCLLKLWWADTFCADSHMLCQFLTMQARPVPISPSQLNPGDATLTALKGCCQGNRGHSSIICQRCCCAQMHQAWKAIQVPPKQCSGPVKHPATQQALLKQRLDAPAKTAMHASDRSQWQGIAMALHARMAHSLPSSWAQSASTLPRWVLKQ